MHDKNSDIRIDIMLKNPLITFYNVSGKVEFIKRKIRNKILVAQFHGMFNAKTCGSVWMNKLC